MRQREAPARVLVDGRNVQHALARAGAADLPTAALVARLRAAFAPPTEIELVLDGHPIGSPSGRIGPGFQVTFSRGASADRVIGERVGEVLRSLGAAGAWSVVVVTDDREVRNHARRSGARVEGTAWLVDRLSAGPAGRATIGNVAPHRPKG
ncbi:MAG TPA: NYN domain-containing protein [Candidatus Binatia bacterium]|nr:NYN domain-containing protein [Candidatus Binatia bacterium]